MPHDPAHHGPDDAPEASAYDQAERHAILALAREAVGAALAGRKPDASRFTEPCFDELRGCFVTLHHQSGPLRGCIGTFEADAPLRDSIVAMAGAVIRDPRFVADPVTLDELDDLVIEVSVLTPRQPLDNPLDLRLGIDGIYMIGSHYGQHVTGCYLPQVAPEQGWDVQQTLEFCCGHKMGLPHDAWRDARTVQCYRFQAQVISEGQVGS